MKPILGLEIVEKDELKKSETSLVQIWQFLGPEKGLNLKKIKRRLLGQSFPFEVFQRKHKTADFLSF